MPWQNVASPSDRDPGAVFAQLRSIEPVEHAIPAPVPPAAPTMPVPGSRPR
jgi:hypothetical protein